MSHAFNWQPAHDLIVDVLEDAAGRSVTVDQIMIALYRKHNKIYKRRSVLRFLSNLATAGKIVRTSKSRYAPLAIKETQNDNTTE